MQRYFAISKRENYFDLRENDYYHIRTVMRMKEQDQVEVVYQGKVYLCCLENVNKNLDVKIEKEVEQFVQKMPRLVLILPFLKEQKMDFIFQKGTELGVEEFLLIPMEHSVVKLEEKKEASKVERWSRICKEAAEQSMRLSIPTVRIERQRENLALLGGIKLLCSTQEREKTIKNVLKNVEIYDTIHLMVGPEGGFTKEEEIYFEQKGFIKVSLGTQIMRVETVPIFLSSIVRYEYME